MLYLTYFIDNLSDGTGAQYQRIIGIISIAYMLNVEYVHTKLKKIDHVNEKDYARIEKFFNIINNFKSVENINYDNVLVEDNPSVDTLTKYKEKSKDKNILLKISLPYQICDSDTTVYAAMMPKLKKILNLEPLIYFEPYKNIKKIAVHVRRGDIVGKNDRFVQIETFVRIIDKLNKKYPTSHFYIFTDIDEKNTEFDCLNKYKNMSILANKDILTTLTHLISADVLVLCKSSFSYISGLYNNNEVYYIDFWHSPLKNWNKVETLLNDLEENFIYEDKNTYSINFISYISIYVVAIIMTYIIYRFIKYLIKTS
jgi:hypothetical protein